MRALSKNALSFYFKILIKLNKGNKNGKEFYLNS